MERGADMFDTNKFAKAGLWLVAVFAVLFGYWGAYVPLDSAVVTAGKVVAANKNYVVQHLEGGIVEDVLVDEGQYVLKGEPVLSLDETVAQIARNRLEARLVQLWLAEQSAIAARDGLSSLLPPKEILEKLQLLDASGEAISHQQGQYRAQLETQQAEQSILMEQIAALNQEIEGHEVQLLSTREQLELVSVEIGSTQRLFNDGLAKRSKLSDLKLSRAQLNGRIGQLLSDTAKAKRQVAEIEEQRNRLTTSQRENAYTELTQSRLEIADTIQQLKNAQFTLDRMTIYAPETGRVMNLLTNTKGSIISRSETLMEIVPQDETINIDAKIRIKDINDIVIGQDVRVSFSAYDLVELSNIAGTISKVTPDRIENERTGEAHYLARIIIKNSERSILSNSKIGPGQAADLYIDTGQQTLLAYIFKPILETFSKSLREK